MANPKFKLEQIGETEYKFTLVKPDGEALLVSEAFTDRTTCERGIELIRQNAWSDGIYAKNKSPEEHYYFDIKLNDRELVATSAKFVEEGELEKNIDEVKKYAPEAELVG